MKIKKYILLNLKRKPIQSLVLVISLTLTLLFGLILTKFLLISHERFSTIAREGQALITSKSNEIDSLLFALNLEGDKANYIPYNLYQTLLNQTQKSFEDGQKVYTKINQVIPFLQFGRIEEKFLVMGTSSDFLTRFNQSDSITFKDGHWIEADNEIVIGQNISTNLHLSLNQNINVLINKSSMIKTFKIVGIIDGKNLAWDRGAYTSINAAQGSLTDAGLVTNSIWKNSILSHILVYVSDDQYPALKSLINDRTVSQLISIPESLNKLENITMSGSYITSILVLLISVLGLCAILGVIITRSESTINSLAILHSLGFEKKHLFKIVIFENLIIWGISSLLATFFYFLFFTWVQSNISFFSSSLITGWSREFGLIFLILGFGIAFLSTIPILILNKIGIHNILRSQ